MQLWCRILLLGSRPKGLRDVYPMDSRQEFFGTKVLCFLQALKGTRVPHVGSLKPYIYWDIHYEGDLSNVIGHFILCHLHFCFCADFSRCEEPFGNINFSGVWLFQQWTLLQPVSINGLKRFQRGTDNPKRSAERSAFCWGEIGAKIRQRFESRTKSYLFFICVREIRDSNPRCTII